LDLSRRRGRNLARLQRWEEQKAAAEAGYKAKLRNLESDLNSLTSRFGPNDPQLFAPTLFLARFLEYREPSRAALLFEAAFVLAEQQMTPYNTATAQAMVAVAWTAEGQQAMRRTASWSPRGYTPQVQ